MSKRDKPGSGRPDDNQDATPPTFGAGSGYGYGTAGRPPGTPPPWAPLPGQYTPTSPPGIPGPPPGIGWYGSQEPGSYYPATGPLAAGAGAGSGQGGAAGGNPGRKRLKHILVFGLGPVVLAGAVAAAYLVSTSGIGHPAVAGGLHVAAASTGGVPQVQNVATPVLGTTSPGASPSPTASLSSPARPTTSASPGNPRSTATATSPAKAPKQNPGPRQPQPSSSGPAQAPPPASASPSTSPSPAAAEVTVPADLGSPDFNGYCASINEGTGVTVASEADGWRCSADESASLSTQAVCAYTFGLPADEVIDVTTDFNSVSGIECWSTHGELGALDFSAYCSAAGFGSAVLTGSDATGWSCSGESDIDENTACEVQYNNISAFARYSSFTDANSWQCWG